MIVKNPESNPTKQSTGDQKNKNDKEKEQRNEHHLLIQSFNELRVIFYRYLGNLWHSSLASTHDAFHYAM